MPEASTTRVGPHRKNVTFILNAISFALTTVAVVFLTFNVTDSFAPVRGTMHSFEITQLVGGGSGNAVAYPHAYPTLDWVMHPALAESGTPNFVMTQTTCQQPKGVTDNGYAEAVVTNCAPEPWQSSSFCQSNKALFSDFENAITGVTGAEKTAIEKQLLAGEGAKKNPIKCESDTKLCYATHLMYDACRISRVGKYASMNNDLMSWSLASGHNADLLYQGAALVLWLVSGFHLINSMFPVRPSDMEAMFLLEQRFTAQKNVKRALGLAAALFYIILRFVAPQTAVETVEDTSVVYAHLLPNGSYFYVLFSIFWVTALGCNDSVFCHMEQTKESSGSPTVIGEVGTVETKGEEAGFPMRTLGRHQKLDAYLPRLAPSGEIDQKDPHYNETINTYDPNVVINLDAFNFTRAANMLRNSCVKFELAQLFVLPLLFLATFVRYNSWEVDSKVQFIFLAGFGYALFDVCKNRISCAATIFDTLHNNTVDGTGDVSTFKKGKKMSDYAKQPVHGAVTIIEVLCILLQFLVFMVVWNTWLDHIVARRKVVTAAADVGREQHMDWSLWFFIVYAVLSAVVKLGQTWTKRKGTSSSKGIFNINNKNYLYGLFCLLVIVSLVNAVFVREPELFNEARNQMNTNMAEILKDNKLLYSHYGKWNNAWVAMH